MNRSLALLAAGFLLFYGSIRAGPRCDARCLSCGCGGMAGCSYEQSSRAGNSVDPNRLEPTYRSYEMDQCQITDAGGNEEQQSTYRHLYDIYVGSIDYRFASFIERHGMQNSFIVDDAKETKAVPAAPAKDRDLTVAQCRADVAAWKSASQSNLPDYAVSLLPIEEVGSACDRDAQMFGCRY